MAALGIAMSGEGDLESLRRLVALAELLGFPAGSQLTIGGQHVGLSACEAECAWSGILEERKP